VNLVEDYFTDENVFGFETDKEKVRDYARDLDSIY